MTRTLTSLTILATCAVTGLALQQSKAEMVKPGAEAPVFSLPGADGAKYALSDFKGKYVVLEWSNKDCPYVRKHYSSHNMQDTQAKAKEMGAVWLTVISSAQGKQGHLSPAEAKDHYAQVNSKAHAVVFDSDGSVGRAYGARNTPQIVIIDPDGKVVYNGAIDDKPTADPNDVKTAHNYALTGLQEAMAGKALSTPTTRPYGCPVKY